MPLWFETINGEIGRHRRDSSRSDHTLFSLTAHTSRIDRQHQAEETHPSSTAPIGRTFTDDRSGRPNAVLFIAKPAVIYSTYRCFHTSPLPVFRSTKACRVHTGARTGRNMFARARRLTFRQLTLTPPYEALHQRPPGNFTGRAPPSVLPTPAIVFVGADASGFLAKVPHENGGQP